MVPPHSLVQRVGARALAVPAIAWPLLALAQPAGAPPPGPPPAMPKMADTHYQSAIAVREGVLVQGQAGPRLDASGSTGLSLHLTRDGYNGVIVSGGRSAFTLRRAQIDLKGQGKNDFLAIGAGVLVRENAAVVIDHATIRTAGAVASALAVAEGATLRVYDSVLVAAGGPLPSGYVRHIGPGMMEPPPPLGLDGTARTVLAMSNARAYFYRTTIEADGWGALSTDAAGDHLYVEANDCVLRVKRRGYAAYADFGAHVVLNRTRVESGAEAGIIAGAAQIDMNGVTGTAGRNGVMIHSVMGNPQEVAVLNLTGTTLASAGPAILVKSANATITVAGGSLRSASGQLLDMRKNDDANATRTDGARVPGVRLVLRQTTQAGSVSNSDPDRTLTLSLQGARLEGALNHVVFAADAASHWRASAASTVTLASPAAVAAIDAPGSVTVTAISADPALAAGPRPLPSGGTLIVVRP
ncbi:hypothetical protein [Novosphingobium sp. SG720]|uniref:hypothetical protein n=1 Tax=Novosphingobium sp. SG720 TaxID=2586998 RepID=UPI001448A022|nr:hypothetical protein [Novosphingobium sp. SG720]NKJ44303.1 hypothetical protein [Novosphingobium sp. SG720]